MTEIDQMDILAYWKMRAWKACNDKENKNTVARKAFIDEVWPD